MPKTVISTFATISDWCMLVDVLPSFLPSLWKVSVTFFVSALTGIKTMYTF